MVGVEAIAAMQLIEACIGIIRTIGEIGAAVKDDAGLPKKLKEIVNELPVINTILRSAKHRREKGKVSDKALEEVKPVIEQCESAIENLETLFEEACPKEGDNAAKRVWKASKAVAFDRGGKFEKLMKTIFASLQLLEQSQICRVEGSLEDLQEAVETWLARDGSKYNHSGSGNLIATEVADGGSNTNNMFSGNSQQWNIQNYQAANTGPKRAGTPPSPTTNIPFPRDPDFVKRGSLLQDMQEKMDRRAGRAALVGIGGSGKSQLAIEYAYRLRERSPATWVFWIFAGNADRFEQGVRKIADLARLDGREGPKVNVLKLVGNWLHDSSSGKWVVILDNADDASFLVEPGHAVDNRNGALFDCLPVCDHGSILITTRSEATALQLVERTDWIMVNPMDEEEASSLLRKKLGENPDERNVLELVAALEYMPLAISQAAAYIHSMHGRCSIAQYLEKLGKIDRSKKSILEEVESDLRRDREAQNSIILTWQISFEHIRQTRPSAADLLSLMSFCDRQAIPELLFTKRSSDGNAYGRMESSVLGDDRSQDGDSNTNSDGSSEVGTSDDSTDDLFDRDISTLQGYSFISGTTDGSVFQMHRLVQISTRKWLQSQGQLEEWKRLYVGRLYAAIPPATSSAENWRQYDVLFPHAKLGLELKPSERDALLMWATVMLKAAWYAWIKGNAHEAEKLAMMSMKVRAKELGHDDVQTLASKTMVSQARIDMGGWAEAEELQVQLVEGHKKVLGAEHPSTLTSMDSLAATYCKQGRWVEAEELQVQVIESRKQVLGPEHPSTMWSMNNLAATCKNQGRWLEAEQLGVQVVNSGKKVLGPNHPATLTSMQSLAVTYMEQERWEEAEELQVQVSETRINVCRVEKYTYLMSMENLAHTFKALGQDTSAYAFMGDCESLSSQILRHVHRNFIRRRLPR